MAQNTPIIVNPSAVQSAIIVALSALITLVAGISTLIPLIGKGDLISISAFFAANQGLTFITAAVSVAGFGGTMWAWVKKHRELVTTASAAPDRVAIVNPAGSELLSSPWAAIGALAVALLLCACATVGSPQTPAQQLYAAIGAYDAALHGANVYAAEPGAKPEIKHALAVAATRATPAVAFARAYPLCHAGVVQIAQDGRPCASFDFSPQGILADVALLQSAIISLQQRN